MCRVSYPFLTIVVEETLIFYVKQGLNAAEGVTVCII